MKNQLKGFITGVLVTLLLVGSVGTAMATVGTKAANLEYSNIKVTLDGTPVKLVDVNGNPVEPFIISGTTYLPVRAVAGAFGLEVDWDGATQTVMLTTPVSYDPSQSQGNGNGTTSGNAAGGNSPGGSETGGNGSGNADNFNTWDNPNQQNTSAKWVLNTSTLKIHYPRCSDVARIAPQNYSTSNLSEEELLRQGFTPCGRCH